MLRRASFGHTLLCNSAHMTTSEIAVSFPIARVYHPCISVQSDPSAAEPSLRHGYAEVNRVRLHYVAQGRGRLILFLHGFPEFWYGWKELLPEFAKDHQTVAVDMRGYNLSSVPSSLDAYQISTLVEDVRALAEKLSAEKFVLVGHDWGGVIAWYFAAAHPELVRKLVIINAPHPTVFARELANNPQQQQASSYFNLFSNPEAESVLSQNDFALPQAVVFTGGWASEADRQAYLECWRRGLTGGLNYYRAANLKSVLAGEKSDQRRFASLTRAISVPTLVIWGEKDVALLTGNLDGLDQHVENLQIHRLPTAGHFVVHEQPAAVIDAMRHFL
jgi:pimeloyl-ACP methyl ester carboxylesterase